MGRSLTLVLLPLSMAALLFASTTQAQLPSCVQNLSTCVLYIENTTVIPSKECCSAITNTLDTELSCLCSFYNKPALLKQLEVNITAALLIPKRCGSKADVNICSKSAAPAAAPGPKAATSIAPAPHNYGSKMKQSLEMMALIVVASLLMLVK